ncbi:hypothetical protein BH11CYA1_BH11CYA1_03860 [soil metagenome]
MLSQVRSLLNDENIDHQSLLEIALADGQAMFAFQTSGSKAVDSWHRLREALGKAAKANLENSSNEKNALLLTPVILGTDQSFELLMEHLGGLSAEPPASTQALVAQGNNIDCQNWLAERLERFVCPTGEWPSAIKVGLVAEADLFEMQDQPLAINNWDQDQHKMALGERVFIGLLPTTKSYEIPILLRFGGQANCPISPEHCAMLKRWSEIYGASLLAIEPGVIECFIEEPPMTKEQALKAAREHYGYCSDRVEQAEGELAPYAYELLNSGLWTFWWD